MHFDAVLPAQNCAGWLRQRYKMWLPILGAIFRQLSRGGLGPGVELSFVDARKRLLDYRAECEAAALGADVIGEDKVTASTFSDANAKAWVVFVINDNLSFPTGN